MGKFKQQQDRSAFRPFRVCYSRDSRNFNASYRSALGRRYRSTIGRYVGRVAVDTRLTYRRSVGWISAECRSISRYVGSVFVSVQPTSVLKNWPRKKNRPRLEHVRSVFGPRLVSTWRPRYWPSLELACSRLSVSGAYRMRPGEVRRAGSGRERGKVGRACKHCFENLIPVYQLPVYPLIGLFWQFISAPCQQRICLSKAKWR